MLEKTREYIDICFKHLYNIYSLFYRIYFVGILKVLVVNPMWIVLYINFQSKSKVQNLMRRDSHGVSDKALFIFVFKFYFT